MQTLRTRSQISLPRFFLVVTTFAWVLTCGTVAKADYTTTAHGDGTDGVNRTGAGFAIGDCAHCHDTFDSDICTGVTGGPNMLFAELDNPDFCMECHTDTDSVQVGGMPAAPGDIAGIFDDVHTGTDYGHDVLGYSGLHRFWYAAPPAQSSADVEDRTYLSANKHVECNDCHNPHTAQAGLHSSNAFQVSASGNDTSGTPVDGAFGVEPTGWNSNWGGASGWPSTSSTATNEYQICFKCHGNYNTNFASWGGSGTESWTNVALEFNPNNGSYHPVVQALPETDPGANGSNRLPPAFTSLLIGDSGLSGRARDFYIDIDPDAGNGKRWVANEWYNWGIRVGTMTMNGDWTFNQVGRVKSNSTISLSVTYGTFALGLPATYESDVVYSIEYYAGIGDRSGDTVTDTGQGTLGPRDLHRYLPSLAGYVVVISDKPGYNVAQGTVGASTSTAFTVDANGWTVLVGSVPTGQVGYYFSATGHEMMCSDCHSNDEISTTAAQGPHGSAVKWMLKGRNRAWPTLASSDNGTGTGTLRKLGMYNLTTHRAIMDGNPNGDGLFCLNCHSIVSFSKNKYGVQDASNVHIPHAVNWPQGPECVRCHIMVPHGGKLSRLIGDRDDAMPARYAFDNDLTNMWVTKYWKTADDPAGYGDGNDYCSVHCHGTCPYHHPCDLNGEDW